MKSKLFRVIDPIATGANIVRLRKERGLSVRDLQTYFGFEEPQAIYKWQRGQSLPTLDNLYALGALLEVPMDEILVQSRPKPNILPCEQQAEAACCSPFFPEYPVKVEAQAVPCSSVNRSNTSAKVSFTSKGAIYSTCTLISAASSAAETASAFRLKSPHSLRILLRSKLMVTTRFTSQR